VKINVLGGGPAGLYFALLAKRREPSHRVTVIERDGPDDTFGWGIVFSDRTLAFLRERDEPTYAAITAASQTWDNVDVVHRGETVSIHGNGFSGIARLTFLHILHRRCREVESTSASAPRSPIRPSSTTATCSWPPMARTAWCAGSTPTSSSPRSTCGRTATCGSAPRASSTASS
jgi:uncharacterized NAD(P)/FAD-binding protein YdhS